MYAKLDSKSEVLMIIMYTDHFTKYFKFGNAIIDYNPTQLRIFQRLNITA